MEGQKQQLSQMGRRSEAPTLNVNERALGYAMQHHVADSITNYAMDADGTRRLQGLDRDDWTSLVQQFKRDPKEAIATARLNLFSISKDPKLSADERTVRIQRYVRAYLELQVKLDVAAFPDNGIPRGSQDLFDDIPRESYVIHDQCSFGHSFCPPCVGF